MDGDDARPLRILSEYLQPLSEFRDLGIHDTIAFFGSALPKEQRPNPFISPDLNFMFRYFFMRKLWFAHLAKAIVIFPGGRGADPLRRQSRLGPYGCCRKCCLWKWNRFPRGSWNPKRSIPPESATALRPRGTKRDQEGPRWTECGAPYLLRSYSRVPSGRS